MPTGGSTTTVRTLLAAGLLALLAGCGKVHVSPLAPPPFQAEIEAGYDEAWMALIRALAAQNVPLRAVARDSGVVASDEFVSPINLYADCGQLGGDQLEGEAVVSFTIFVEPNGATTRLQVNSKMRTLAHRRGRSGKLRPAPVYACASTGRFEANLLDAVREHLRR
jgi:hypothetical protein